MKAAPHIHAENAASLTDSGVIVDSKYCGCYQSYHQTPRTASRMDYYLQLVQEYLLSLGGLNSNIPQPSTQSLTDMLRVLKFATEIYLHAQTLTQVSPCPSPLNTAAWTTNPSNPASMQQRQSRISSYHHHSRRWWASSGRIVWRNA
jgi:hypothetical protein